jgi:hypothetical protein
MVRPVAVTADVKTGRGYKLSRVIAVNAIELIEILRLYFRLNSRFSALNLK